MPEWKRVRSKNGPGHEYSVQVVDPARHELLVNKDAEDAYGRPLPAKYQVSKTDRTAAKSGKTAHDNAAKEQS